MPKQDIVLKGVEVPEGYEATGEFRAPMDEPSLFGDGFCEHGRSRANSIILRRIEPDAVKLAKWVRKAWPKEYDCRRHEELLAELAVADRIINDFEGKR